MAAARPAAPYVASQPSRFVEGIGDRAGPCWISASALACCVSGPRFWSSLVTQFAQCCWRRDWRSDRTFHLAPGGPPSDRGDPCGNLPAERAEEAPPCPKETGDLGLRAGDGVTGSGGRDTGGIFGRVAPADGQCRSVDGTSGECTDRRDSQAAGIAAAVGSAAFLTGALVVVPVFAVRKDREDRKTATAATAATVGIGIRIRLQACCESTSSCF